MNYITEEIGAVVERMRPIDVSYGQGMIDYLDRIKENANLSEKPFYMYGHRLEISNRLSEKGQDKTLKYRKYPLVALRMNIPATRENDVWSFTLNIAFVAYTDLNLNAEERMQRVIYPVLFPLYNRFLDELWKCGKFMFPNAQGRIPEHEPIVKPFYGTPESSTQKQNEHIFKDPLDCIEIENLRISQRVKNC